MLGPQVDNDNLIVDNVTLGEGLFHFATIGWKFIFAIVPPSRYQSGAPSFFIALCLIGLLTAIVEQVATLFGCALGIPKSINAITIVALGTSLPDTFASKTAAQTSKYADSAIGNITGSNSVNVFLGLGLPWVIAANWYSNRNRIFNYPSGTLGYSVFLFLICSVACFLILIFRRIVSTLYLYLHTLICLGRWRRNWWSKGFKIHHRLFGILFVDYLCNLLNFKGCSMNISK